MVVEKKISLKFVQVRYSSRAQAIHLSKARSTAFSRSAQQEMQCPQICSGIEQGHPNKWPWTPHDAAYDSSHSLFADPDSLDLDVWPANSSDHHNGGALPADVYCLPFLQEILP